MPRRSLRRDKEDYIERSFDKNRARSELAREEEIENNLLVILREDYHSTDEGAKGYTPESLFLSAKCKDKSLNIKDFVSALNRLSGDGLFRSRKRICLDFVDTGRSMLFADELKKRLVHLVVTPIR